MKETQHPPGMPPFLPTILELQRGVSHRTHQQQNHQIREVRKFPDELL